MLINTLELKNKRKKRKTIGRGGKKGTYSGKGNKGQKARSGAKVNPLFEGGRSTLVDHMKKIRGFKSKKPKKNVVKLAELERKFNAGDTVSVKSLVSLRLVDEGISRNGVKILNSGKISKNLIIEKGILLSSSAKEAIEKAGGEVLEKKK